MAKEDAVAAGLYEVIGEEDRRCVISHSLKSQVAAIRMRLSRSAANLKIVYTPLHGTGNIPARRVIKGAGL